MKKQIHIIPSLLIILLAGATLVSCKKMLDIKPQDSLDASEFYKNVNDANVAVMGIYGKMYGIAEQYIILNELRGDLLDVTDNSNEYLKQICYHEATANNPWVDASSIYSIIRDCNDFLYNLKKMHDENRILGSYYWPRYADIASLRAWLYLQLGLHYGEVPYVTDRFSTLNDIQDSLNVTVLPMDALVDELIRTLENLQTEGLNSPEKINPLETVYDVTNDESIDKELNLYSGKSNEASSLMYISKPFLMGDLYLWQQNYHQAAVWYRKILNTTTTDDRITYKLSSEGSFFGKNKTWSNMFNSKGRDDVSDFSKEWMWMMYFDATDQPDPFVTLFTPVGLGKGEYLIKPSMASIFNFSEETGSAVADNRGIQSSYHYMNSDPFVYKYTADYLSGSNNNELIGRWYFYRAGMLHLRFAEAANRDGKNKLAWALLNNGIYSAYDIYAGLTDANTYDHTNTGCTFDATPYDFNGRKGDNPYFLDEYSSNMGVRGRAGMDAYNMPAYIITKQDSMLRIEDCIFNEDVLELAYEGNRWGDLVRLAKRRNDPSIVANAVYKKMIYAGRNDAFEKKAKLMNENNWYLPAISFK
jgi:hypothetical protein